MTAIFPYFVSLSTTVNGKNRIVLTPPKPSAPASWRPRSVTIGLFLLLIILALPACAPGNLGSSTRGWAPAVASNGVVFVADFDGKVKALNDTGSTSVSVKWTYPPGEEQLDGVFNTPVVGNRLIYVAAADGVLHAVNKATGILDWKTSLVQDEADQLLASGPTLDRAERVVIVGSDDNHLYALHAGDSERSGEIKWRFQAEDKIWSTPVISDGTVYFGSHDNNVYALDLSNGEEKWRFSTGGAVVAKPLVARDQVIVGSFDRKLYGLDATDGALVWTFDGASNWFWAGAVASSGAIYAPSMDGKVYALDWRGNKIWEHDMESPIVSTPVLLARGLVVASKSGKIRLIDLSSGNSINDLDISPAEIRSPLFTLPSVDDNLSQSGIQVDRDDQRESVFVGAQDNVVRRIDFKSGARMLWCFDTKDNEVYKEKGCPQ